MNETEPPAGDAGPERADAAAAPGASDIQASGPGRRMTMAEYEEATSPRGQAARARGLAAPYIPGGRDPDPAAGRREERYYLRLLLLMVAVIVLAGFAITIAGFLVAGGS